MQTMYQIARLVISASPVIIGVFILFNVLTNIAASNTAAEWPTAPGVVTEARASGTLSLYNKQSYISYRYEVNGNVYTGNSVYFGGGSVSNYHSSQPVLVYYNPQNFSDSVLEVGLRMGYLFTLLIGAGLVMVGKVLWKRLQ